MEDKRQIRRQISRQRRRLSQQQYLHASNQACRRLQQLNVYQWANHIAYYAPFKGEISPLPALNVAMRQSKQCYLPKLDPLRSHTMRFCLYRPQGRAHYNHLGIYEPEFDEKQAISAWALQVVTAPLLAFDHKGYRLGWGGGYYDNTFSFIREWSGFPRPWLIGLAYDWQRFEALPHSEHDIPLDAVVTDHGTYCFNQACY